ncbi:hypothetical protein E3N88_01502 [Mikania micrantha]|uniref:Reverse transcriptase domain-containing protein n=1 Tax=Mikania micrantha TaxID=192012 RepID=A0A5N6Q2R5_9ASTR|nr:hypothetical protein E3N88_01502 [Mikania micrantha]
MFQVSGNSDESEDASIDPQISLHAITGIPSYSTMKIVGAIGTKPLQILIDSGSTHKFLNDKIVDKLNCVIQSVKNMPVTIADGNQLSCVQLCKDFQWLMQGNWFKVDMLVIPLSTYDIVLGIQWLQTLNDISWNFKNLTMKFTVANKCIELKGTNVNTVTMCSMEKVNSIVSTPNQLIHCQLFSLKLVNNDECFQHQPKAEGIHNSKELQRLLDEFQDIFEVPKGLPPSRDCDHKIKLKDDSIQLNLKPYRYPAAQKNIIEQMTQELLDSGFIRNSTSSFAAPVVLVKKKDGSWRMCVDYRRLNAATVKDVYPIPLIEELLDELGGATVFSKLDLRSGYHQVRMHTHDIHKTAFKTHQGHYDFLVLPFGLTNAPATFQSLMNTTFKPVLRRCTLVFFYDILVYSRSIQQHVQDLKEVLVLMCLHSLKAKHSKCTFGGNQVEYLGHIISEKGVSTDPEKIKAINSWPTPTTIKQLRGFLGLAGYYRRFIKGFGMIARPMTELLKKDAFKWNDDAQESFQNLKTALTTPPVLALPDFSKEFIIETDASANGLGAVLMQNNHPLAFISKALSIRQQALSVYEKELLAILLAVKQWHRYLIVKHFTIRTDQQSLKHLLDQKIITPLQQIWLSKLVGYDYDIVYKKGSENSVADALSRVQGLALFTMAISSLQPMLWQRIQQGWQNDPLLKDLIVQLEKGAIIKNRSWNGQMLCRKNKLLIAHDSVLRNDIIQLCHSYSLGGHSGVKPTLIKLKEKFYWKGCSKDVHRYVKDCSICQRAKYETIATPGYYNLYQYLSPFFRTFQWILYPVFLRLQGITLALSSAYHPQSDGQTEVLNRCLESYLRAMTMDAPLQWIKWLPLAQWWYNTTFHSAIKMSPYEALFGVKAPVHIPFIPGDTQIAAVEELHRDREGMIKKLKFNLELHSNQKLSPRYFGPYLIVEKIGACAYKLDLPPDSCIHPTFHVSLLKPAHGSILSSTQLPSALRFTLQPRAVIDRKLIRKGNKAGIKVLVHWEGLAITDATWEWLDELKLRFPSFVF